ncbi:MAG TPA: RsmE family RNA methyltransferase [Chthonomonadaceae bacterium]|nr:RsmE family RNA methyltransferase [Chthonomonadaceae bacterium]
MPGHPERIVRLFLAPEQFDFAAGTARIAGQDHVHVARVLRARTGDALMLLDGSGAAYRATLADVGPRESTARIDCGGETAPEPIPTVHVFQALCKADKFDQVIQHGTEAGATSFTPVHADRCVAELSQARMPERLARWRAIAKGAAEQSGRAVVPSVLPLVAFGAALGTARPDHRELRLLLHGGGDAKPLSEALTSAHPDVTAIFVFVGPEGGWSEREQSLAEELSCATVSLGPHVLRTETAALVAVSQIRYEFARAAALHPI